MIKFILFVVVFMIMEILIAFLFAVVAQVFYKRKGIDFKSIAKGIIERLFLIIALTNNYPHALTLFSALKLGTRLKRSDEGGQENSFNDYYLLGNLISVSLAIGYVYLYTNYSGIEGMIRNRK